MMTSSPENPVIDSRFSCHDGGIWFDSGNGEPRRIADEFQVKGYAYDASGEPYYILQHQGNSFALPWTELGERGGWRIMRRYIRRLPTNKRYQERLVEYLQTQPLDERWVLTDTAGWQGEAYILPNGEIIGAKEKTLFQRMPANPEVFSPSGTLHDWQKAIGQYLAGNSRLCLFVGAAFAAPLLRWFGIDGGILHIYGDSSKGKSTAQQVALSVWGHGKDAGHSWNATGHALTNAAAARNDGLLSLDEIGEDTQNAVQTCAYTIANGRARLQGSKDGGNRPELRFRVFAISSGEHSLATHLGKQGREIMAGQLVRFPSIPHTLEEKHHFDSFRTFADHLKEASIATYGAAGRVFIEKLCKGSAEEKEAVKKLYIAFLQELNKTYPMTAQQNRTARLFAACGAGLMLASQWAISGITVEQARQGVLCSFADWYDNQPKGNIEEIRIREHAENWMQQHAQSYRFSQWQDNQTHPDHAGYHRYSLQELETINRRQGRGLKPEAYNDLQEYWIIPAVFEREICNSYEPSRVCEALHTIGWLKRYNSDSVQRWKHQRYGKGWYYVFQGMQPNVLSQPD